MLCADINCWIAYFAGELGKDTDFLGEQLDRQSVVMAPVVLSELFSDPELDRRAAFALGRIPLLETGPGYWERAGRPRASLRRGITGRNLPTLSSPSLASIIVYHC